MKGLFGKSFAGGLAGESAGFCVVAGVECLAGRSGEDACTVWRYLLPCKCVAEASGARGIRQAEDHIDEDTGVRVSGLHDAADGGRKVPLKRMSRYFYRGHPAACGSRPPRWRN